MPNVTRMKLGREVQGLPRCRHIWLSLQASSATQQSCCHSMDRRRCDAGLQGAQLDVIPADLATPAHATLPLGDLRSLA